MLKLFRKQKDERVQAELNAIYRTGYMVMTVGILLDLFLQFTGVDVRLFAGEIGNARPIEFLAFVGANILCVILMLRKGIGDDSSRYAETDRFPHLHYLGISALCSLAAAVVFGGMLAYGWRYDPETMPIAVTFAGGSLFVICTLVIYLTQYACFVVAKKRRAEIAGSLEDDEE